jgi:16S rRNA (cytidine1402-2'-O)-methyltransferase
MRKGKLYLIPTILSEGTTDKLFSPLWRDGISHIRHFCVENVRTARRFLSSLKIFPSIEELDFAILDKETDPENISELLKPILSGNDVGVISESGIPGVADPGNLAVTYAHANEIKVTVLPGSSSILLALAASGLNGQQFAFHGYLPIDEKECARTIKSLENESKTKGQTQIFIETPFRNNRLLKTMIKNLSPASILCLALDITGSEERIICKKVSKWPKVDLPKLPAIFLFQG